MLGGAVLPGAGAIWHGQPVWSMGPVPSKVPVCLLKAYPTYLDLWVLAGREITYPPAGCKLGRACRTSSCAVDLSHFPLCQTRVRHGTYGFF